MNVIIVLLGTCHSVSCEGPNQNAENGNAPWQNVKSNKLTTMAIEFLDFVRHPSHTDLHLIESSFHLMKKIVDFLNLARKEKLSENFDARKTLYYSFSP